MSLAIHTTKLMKILNYCRIQESTITDFPQLGRAYCQTDWKIRLIRQELPITMNLSLNCWQLEQNHGYVWNFFLKIYLQNYKWTPVRRVNLTCLQFLDVQASSGIIQILLRQSCFLVLNLLYYRTTLSKLYCYLFVIYAFLTRVHSADTNNF